MLLQCCQGHSRNSFWPFMHRSTKPCGRPFTPMAKARTHNFKAVRLSEVIGSCAMGEPGWCLASLRQGLTRAAVFSNAQHFNLPLFIMQYFSTRLTLSLVLCIAKRMPLFLSLRLLSFGWLLLLWLFFFLSLSLRSGFCQGHHFPCRSRCRTLVQNIPYTVARGCSVFHFERFGLWRC